jgi:hypothetical protein
LRKPKYQVFFCFCFLYRFFDAFILLYCNLDLFSLIFETWKHLKVYFLFCLIGRFGL